MGAFSDENVEDSDTYNLVAVVSHVGNSIDSGHYIAHAKRGPSEDEKQWFKFNDERVSKSNELEA